VYFVDEIHEKRHLKAFESSKNAKIETVLELLIKPI
jgi:hypothetical protein